MDYLCPGCLHTLRCDTGLYRCPNCNSGWQIKSGVPVFLGERKPVYFKGDTEKSQELIEITRNYGWEKAVERSKDADFKGRFGGFHADGKINWVKLVNLKPDARVLDVGSGWGGIAVALSKRCKEVAAMDITYERCLFLTLRAQQEGLRNISCFCAGTMEHFPLPSDYFDLVVFNGVLEWMPLSQEGSPIQVQKNALSEAHRVLKDKGLIYIGIENRFGLNYLLGDPDPHTKLKYGNVLPRVVADIYSRLKQGRPFRTFTHSFWGYKELLRERGFNDIQMFWPVPDYRKFEKVINLNDKHLLWEQLKSQAKTTGFKNKITAGLKSFLVYSGIYKKIVPSFSIVAVSQKT